MNSCENDNLVVNFILGGIGTISALWLLWVAYHKAPAANRYLLPDTRRPSRA